MDSILSGLIILLIFLLATFTLTSRFFNAQEVVRDAWQEAETRLDEQDRTLLLPLRTSVMSNGSVVEVVYRNAGSTRMIQFETWDVILQYATEDAQQYVIQWLPEDATAIANSWKVQGIYQDAVNLIPEFYEAEILNPGEEIMLQLQLAAPIGHGQPVLVVVMTGNGAAVSTQVTRNVPPVLVVNTGLSLTSQTTAQILTSHLQAIDVDNAPDDLTFSIVQEPQQGELSLPVTFTQAQIDSEEVYYKHTGTGNDSFTFYVSDADDVIGSFTFIITTLNAAPTLVNNYVLPAPSMSTTMIASLMLSVTDVDNTPDELIYLVSLPPTLGMLAPGDVFTQADLEAGGVTYTRSSDGLDHFEFSVTDGEATIGPFTFYIGMP